MHKVYIEVFASHLIYNCISISHNFWNEDISKTMDQPYSECTQAGIALANVDGVEYTLSRPASGHC